MSMRFTGILAAMQHPGRICALLAAAALALGGCGSSGPNLPKDIPVANAFGLNGYLVRAQQACKVGDRFALRDAARLYSNAVTDLPSSVDPDVITVLRKGGDSLNELAQTGEGCATGATGATGISGVVP
jgi:hypothetical protein